MQSPDLEVVWNGTMDPPFVRQHQRQPPPEWLSPIMDCSNDYVPARFVAHLQTAQEHTSRSVASGMRVSSSQAGDWLYRARRLGILQVVRRYTLPTGGVVRVYARVELS